MKILTVDHKRRIVTMTHIMATYREYKGTKLMDKTFGEFLARWINAGYRIVDL